MTRANVVLPTEAVILANARSVSKKVIMQRTVQLPIPARRLLLLSQSMGRKNHSRVVHGRVSSLPMEKRKSNLESRFSVTVKHVFVGCIMTRLIMLLGWYVKTPKKTTALNPQMVVRLVVLLLPRTMETVVELSSQLATKLIKTFSLVATLFAKTPSDMSARCFNGCSRPCGSH